MATEKDDTDPSSPGALRTPSGRHPRTDPGLGPNESDPPPPAPARRSSGVVVPAPSMRSASGPSAVTPPEMAPVPPRPLTAKDSVELLLEGMSGPRPDRRKTKSQSDGDASAAYHAEHGVRRARMGSEPGPKVLVERPPFLGAVSDERPARRIPSSREALSTFVPAKVLRRRVLVAVAAGAIIVLFLFMGLRVTSQRSDAVVPMAPAETAAQVAPAADPGHATAPTANVTSAPAPTGVPSEPRVPATTERAPPPTPGTAAPASGAITKDRHNKASSPSPPSNNGGLGEFKTAF
jgi:hypothetical protein